MNRTRTGVHPMRYARHASRYSLFALAVSAALLPGARVAANRDHARA
ncbi:hypothetical protein GRH76_25010, partial [Pseudomonas aeruginosa]|nr:hypothetical protein [Pseudomonas aeruginosa]